MKNTTIRLATLPLALAAALTLVTGCGSTRTGTLGAAPALPGAASHFTTSEREFATQAATGGLYEVEVSRLAAQRAVNVQVKNYAQMLVTHHTQANNELADIMKVKNFAPPAGLPADKQAKIARLQALSGAEFDREYVRLVGLQDHQADIALFERGARDSSDPDLKAWILKTLPTLRNHLQAAQNLAGMLAG